MVDYRATEANFCRTEIQVTMIFKYGFKYGDGEGRFLAGWFPVINAANAAKVAERALALKS